MPQTPATRPGPEEPLLKREPQAAWVLGATLPVCLILAVLTFVAIALLRWPLAWVLAGIGSVACLWAYRVLGRIEVLR